VATFPTYSGSIQGGYYYQNLLSMAEYLMSNGYSRAGASGVAGAVAGESAGNPESIQYPNDPDAGGGGLIQWTPPTKAGPDTPILSGDPQTDWKNQLVDILAFNDSAGSVASLNAQTNPVDAADYYSQNFERPLVTDSDVRAGVANQIYADLANYKPNSAYTQVGVIPGGGGQNAAGQNTDTWTTSDFSMGSNAMSWATGMGGIPGSTFLDIPEDIISGFGSAGSAAASIADLAKVLATSSHDMLEMFKLAMWLFEPNNWLRIGAFLAGILLLGGGLFFMGKAVGIQGPQMPTVVPVPV
jgi:hypothetical protein